MHALCVGSVQGRAGGPGDSQKHILHIGKYIAFYLLCRASHKSRCVQGHHSAKALDAKHLQAPDPA